MTRLFRNEPIQVRRHSQTEQPLAIQWHERIHKVARVVGEYRVECDWWTEHGEVGRDVYTVITAGESPLLLDIYFDLDEKQWYAYRLYD